MKKLLIWFSVIIIFAYPLINVQNKAHALPVVSKAATKAATKAAKEVIGDAAVQMAMDIVFNLEMNEIMKDDYKDPSQGYTAVCMEKQGDKCTKPMQAKVPSTSAEKKQLKDKVEDVLNRKTGTTGWKKFADWFGPVFLLSAAFVWVETQFDSDTKDLFDEVAKEALEEAGMVGPLGEINPIKAYDLNGNPITPPAATPVTNGQVVGTTSEIAVYEMNFSNTAAQTQSLTVDVSMPFLASVTMLEFSSNKPDAWISRYSIFGDEGYRLTHTSGEDTLSIKGTGIPTGTHTWKNNSAYNVFVNGEVAPSSYRVNIPNINQPIRVAVGGAKTSDGKYYVQGLMQTVGNNYATYETTTQSYITGQAHLTNVSVTSTNMIGYDMKVKISFYPSAIGIDYSTPYTPDLTEFPELDISKSVFSNGDGSYKVPSNKLIPVKTPDGTVVKPDGKGGWVTPIGIPVQVDEDTLIVEDVQPTPDDDGYVAPDGTIVPKPTPPGGGQPGTPTSDDEPDPGKNKKKLEDKSREWGPLLTTKFPFSLPWDFFHLMGVLWADPVAPRWEVKGTEKIPLDFTIDLSFMDPYIKWFRAFILFSFIASTIFMHGRFMGGSK